LVRYGAALALGEIGNASAVGSLIGALKDENWEVRAMAAEAIGKIGDARAVDPLTESLEDENERVREEASRALVKLRGASPEELKAMMIESMERVETVDFTVDTDQTVKLVNHSETNETLRTMTLETRSVGEGVLNTTARAMKMTINSTTSSADIKDVVSEMEMYMQNDTMYTKINGDWTRMQVMSEEMLDQNQLIIQVKLLNASEIELIGSGAVNGEDAYMMKVVPDMETYTTIVDQQMISMQLSTLNVTEVLEGSEMNWTIWISKESYLPLKNQVSMKLTITAGMVGFPVDEVGDIEMEIQSNSTEVYSIYNDPVVIENVVDDLISNLKYGTLDVRYSAAISLGEIGDPRAVDSLIDALKDEDRNVRGGAANALGDIGDPKAVDPLIQVLNDPETYARGWAAEALGNIGNLSAIDPLIQVLYNDPDRTVRGTAARALGRIGDPQAVEPLILKLNDSEWSVRSGVSIALGNIGDPRAVNPLIQALKDPDSYTVRKFAAEALGKIGDTRAIGALTYAVQNDKEEDVRRAATEALGKIEVRA
jgi:HEAT repeat protein